MDTTQIVVDYLCRNPASAYLVNGPFGYMSLMLEICEREPGKLSVLCDANLFQSIVQVTKSDVAQDMVRLIFFRAR